MKKKLLTILGVTMIIASMSACGTDTKNVSENAGAEKSEAVSDNKEATDKEATDKTESNKADETAEIMTYEFETFDGLTVVINEGTIVSQEACDEPLEWAGLPADAEQIAPGRDYILFEDDVNYYVEDTVNGLVTVAFKELGDVVDSDIAIFDNNVYSFIFDPEYFVVNEDSEFVTVSFYNEETQTAGSNTITFTEIKDADAETVAKEFAKQYGVSEADVTESNFGEKGYTSYSVVVYPAEGEGVQTRSMALAIENGDNVIAVEILNHVEPDEGMDMFINDKLAEVVDTFTID